LRIFRAIKVRGTVEGAQSDQGQRGGRGVSSKRGQKDGLGPRSERGQRGGQGRSERSRTEEVGALETSEGRSAVWG